MRSLSLLDQGPTPERSRENLLDIASEIHSRNEVGSFRQMKLESQRVSFSRSLALFSQDILLESETKTLLEMRPGGFLGMRLYMSQDKSSLSVSVYLPTKKRVLLLWLRFQVEPEDTRDLANSSLLSRWFA